MEVSRRGPEQKGGWCRPRGSNKKGAKGSHSRRFGEIDLAELACGLDTGSEDKGEKKVTSGSWVCYRDEGWGQFLRPGKAITLQIICKDETEVHGTEVRSSGEERPWLRACHLPSPWPQGAAPASLEELFGEAAQQGAQWGQDSAL